MIDSPNDSGDEAETTFQEQVAQAKGEADAAGKAFMAAVATYVEAVKQHYGMVRWSEGFGDGWDAAQEQFKSIQKKFEMEIKTSTSGGTRFYPVTVNTPTILGSIGTHQASPPQTPTANELVLQFVTENPGRRGVEIANNFAKHAFRLRERTVRTALHRLKTAEPPKIKIVDGRWYAADAAPADPLFAAME
jgi:hypothetical protein